MSLTSIEENYMLEISSPGEATDILKRKRLYVRKRCVKEVELKLFKAIDGVKEFEGTLGIQTR